MLTTCKTHNICFFKAILQYRSSRLEVFSKKEILRNFTKFTRKHLCQNVFFNKVVETEARNFILKRTLTQVFSCEFCEISLNTFSCRAFQVVASSSSLNRLAEVVGQDCPQKRKIFSKIPMCEYDFETNLFEKIICQERC